MREQPLRPWERWAYALKPASWPKLGAPFLLGQALGSLDRGGLDAGAFAVGALFTVAYLAYIVLLNDWGDREVDRIKRDMFPSGCSPKTIPDHILPERTVLAAGLAAGALALLVTAVGGPWLDRPALGVLAGCAVLIFQTYTFGPVRLNYRGGGELLEVAGIGVAVPLVNAYAQSGRIWGPAHGLLIGHALATAASALASGLADERSDRAGGKRTFTTMFGNATVRGLVDGALRLAGVAWVVVGLQHERRFLAAALVGAVIVFHFAARARRKSPAALTDAFEAQRHYKTEVHRAIWYGTAALALALWAFGGSA